MSRMLELAELCVIYSRDLRAPEAVRDLLAETAAALRARASQEGEG